MFSSRQGDPAPYPDVPDSLRDDSFEMTEMPKTQAARADTSPYLTPYLSLRSRLSQIWINRWTVLLILVLIRVIIVIAQLNDNIGSAKVQALDACTNVEDIGSAMASMPHYLSVGVNELAGTTIDHTVSALVSTLNLILSAVEGLILFFINFMTATYTCLITAMIHGSLDMVADTIDGATDDFNDIVNKATKEIDDISGDLQDAINKLTDGIQDSIIGGVLPDIPKVDFSKPVNDLKKFDLNADDFEKDIRTVNKEIPTFDQVQNLTNEAVSIPFDAIRKAINSSWGDYSFDTDVFPIAQKEQMTFCSDNDKLSDFFKKLYDIVEKARIGFIVVIIIAAILVMAPMAWLEIQRWRRQQKHAKLIQRNMYDPIDVVYIASRPMTASWGIKMGSRFKGKNQILIRWCIAYATSTPALFVLSLAAAGFFSCLCQLIILKAVQSEVPALASEIGNFADEIVTSLQGVSEKWATDANHVIGDMEGNINDDVLVYITNGTSAVNDTLNTFMDTMNDGLDDAFGGTILLDPMKTVVDCVIGNKVENIQDGLTWVHDHAHISLPRLDKDIFSLGANESITSDSELNTFLASPQSVTTDEVTAAVKHVTDWLHDNLIQEALLSTGIFLVYVIVVLLGVVRMLYGMAMPDRGRGEGGLRFTGDERPPLSPRSAQAHAYDNEGGTAFPRFGSSSSDEAPAYRMREPGPTGEKMMSGAQGTWTTQTTGVDRSSSYGYIGTSGKQ